MSTYQMTTSIAITNLNINIFSFLIYLGDFNPNSRCRALFGNEIIILQCSCHSIYLASMLFLLHKYSRDCSMT